ncbi:hypothetical protein UCREL1_8115 [Eutypa lata UCREL1]|uniref:Uncharacterized protein n=1 Tax=Eutypa lata (strain UCR-EL1) TaxID=1287681 RepID=M7SKN1_EUTLA|nr:hypothetical protein UCREL1_8115 [Eutypa lata UCREL1]
MPPCSACSCPTCTLASVYTVTFSLLCSTGLTPQPYTITETYVGMSALPGFASPTSVPFGFTTAVVSCGACKGGGGGVDGGMIATVTFPSAGRPYADGFTATEPVGVGTAPTAGASAPGGAEGNDGDETGGSEQGDNGTETVAGSSYHGEPTSAAANNTPDMPLPGHSNYNQDTNGAGAGPTPTPTTACIDGNNTNTIPDTPATLSTIFYPEGNSSQSQTQPQSQPKTKPQGPATATTSTTPALAALAPGGGRQTATTGALFVAVLFFALG